MNANDSTDSGRKAAFADARRDLIVGLIVVVLSLVFWFVLIPRFVLGPSDDKFLAYLIAAAMGALGLAVLVRNFLICARTREARAAAESRSRTEGIRGRSGFVLILLLWAIDVLLVDIVGFYILSPIAIAATLYLLGVNSPRSIALWTILPFLAVYLIFELGLGVRLPRGLL